MGMGLGPTGSRRPLHAVVCVGPSVSPGEHSYTVRFQRSPYVTGVRAAWEGPLQYPESPGLL